VAPAGAQTSLFALQLAQKSAVKKTAPLTTTLASTPWDPVARLPAALQARLGPADRRAITAAVSDIQRAVVDRGLSFVPVFGYLSLRTNNFAELGKASQADVVVGADVVDATLKDHDVDVVASTVFRGTPEHAGAVAGLSRRPGRDTPGAMLKVPVERAEELLAVLLARELFAEGDLADGVDDAGGARSNAMYAPAVRDIVVDGQTVPAFLFVTNTSSEKAIAHNAAFADDVGLSVGRMAWLFAASGGFVGEGGAVAGGRALDYWRVSYQAAREAAGQPVDPTIAAAIDRAALMPQQHVVDALLARSDSDARLMVRALAVLFAGAVSPLSLQTAQVKGAVERVAAVDAVDNDAVTAALLQQAKAMAAAGEL
jgi:hypothetical protein